MSMEKQKKNDDALPSPARAVGMYPVPWWVQDSVTRHGAWSVRGFTVGLLAQNLLLSQEVLRLSLQLRLGRPAAPHHGQ